MPGRLTDWPKLMWPRRTCTIAFRHVVLPEFVGREMYPPPPHGTTTMIFYLMMQGKLDSNPTLRPIDAVRHGACLTILLMFEIDRSDRLAETSNAV